MLTPPPPPAAAVYSDDASRVRTLFPFIPQVTQSFVSRVMATLNDVHAAEPAVRAAAETTLKELNDVNAAVQDALSQGEFSWNGASVRAIDILAAM